MSLFSIIAARLIRIADRRPPDFVIGGPAHPYLRRWFVIPRNRWFNVYLHQFLRSDDDRALHDHPWANCSILLQGSYTEVTFESKDYRFINQWPFMEWVFHYQRHTLRAGAVRLRLSGTFAHRIELTDGVCWTLFITGPRYREWGFHCPRAWVHWEDFTAPDDAGAVGKGCGE